MRYVETIENKLLVGDQQLDFPSKFAPWTFERGVKQLKEKKIYIYIKRKKKEKKGGTINRASWRNELGWE